MVLVVPGFDGTWFAILLPIMHSKGYLCEPESPIRSTGQVLYYTHRLTVDCGAMRSLADSMGRSRNVVENEVPAGINSCFVKLAPSHLLQLAKHKVP